MASVEGTYNRHARRYDFTSRIPLLLGFRTDHYRHRAVESLRIGRGDMVVLIGCGTGTDIPRVQKHLAGTGSIVCVDISEGMLNICKRKVAKRGWTNVEFWHGDAADFPWPVKVDHVVANFTLKFQPRHREVLERAHRAMRPGGRFVIADFRMPRWAYPIATRALATFGHDAETLDRDPLVAFEEVFGGMTCNWYWFGGAYVAMGEKE